jgi:hypothetical protein
MKQWEGGDSSLDVLGIQFDLRACTAAPTAAMKERLRALTRASLQGSSENRIANYTFIQWFGTIQWLSYSTARLPLCFCPHVMSTIRDICRHQAWDGYVSRDAALVAEICRVSNACENAVYRPRDVQRSSTGLRMIWTDASTTAIAAVDPVQRVAFSHPILCTNRQICQAELIAGMAGFFRFDSATVWVTDNQAAARAVVRGHSGSATCDSLLREWLRSGRVPTHVLWVDTACQIADGLTRTSNPPALPRPCAARHQLLRVRWGEEGAGVLSKDEA